MVYEITLYSLFSITEVMRVNVSSESITETLNISENIDVKPFIISIIEPLSLSERIGRQDSIQTISLTDSFTISDTTKISFDYQFTDLFALYSTSDPNYANATDHFNITDSVVFEQAIGVYEVFEIADLDELPYNYSEVIGITEEFLVDDDILVIATFDDCPQLELTPRNYFTLSNGTLTVNLRNPNFEDIQTLNTPKVILHNMSGESRVTYNKMTPNFTTFNLVFTDLKYTEILDLQNLINTRIGKLLSITDNLNRTFNGVILNPLSLITGINRGGYSISMDIVAIGDIT